MELCNTRQVVLARLYHGSGDEEMTDKISYNEWIKKIELARKEARTALLAELEKFVVDYAREHDASFLRDELRKRLIELRKGES